MRILSCGPLLAVAILVAWAPVRAAGPTVDFVVTFRDGIPAAERRDWAQGSGGTVQHEFRTGNAVWVRLPAGRAADAELLRADPRVAHVEADVCGIPDLMPDDPLYAGQQHLRNLGYPDKDIQAEPAWAIRHEAPTVTVAVIDDGFLLQHPDLADNFVPGFDCADFDADPSPDPAGSYYAHGTGVAGLLAAVGNNGIGVAGVCWDLRVMPLKHHRNGSPWYSGSVATAAAVDRAVAAGVDVIVCSFHYPAEGLDVSPQSQFYRSFRAASDAGIVIVASAGNDGKDLDDPANARYPASFDFANVVTVAMTGDDGLVPHLASAYGAETVEIAAPGFPVQSTWVDESRQPTYMSISGTSAAAPLVAGAIALIKAELPGISYPEAALALLFGRAEIEPGNQDFVVDGRRLNIYRPLVEPDLVAPDPAGEVAVAGMTDTSITLRWTEPGEDGPAGQLDHFTLEYRSDDRPATPFADMPAPAGAGTVHSVTVGGLPWGNHVDLTLSAVDDYRNRASVPVAVDLPKPLVAATNLTAFFMARTGALRDSTVTYRNSGDWEGILTAELLAGGDWLQLPEEPLRVAPGDSLALPYSCDASGLCAGLYTAQIGVIGAVSGPVTVTLVVLDAPQVAVTPAEVDLGAVAAGAILEPPLSISNTGCSDLHWSAAVEPAGAGSLEPASGTLAPGAVANLSVSIGATAAGAAQVVVSSDDPFEPATPVTIHWSLDHAAGVRDDVATANAAPVWEGFPNPLNPRTAIRFTLREPGAAELRIFDLRGAVVRTIPLAAPAPGITTVDWDGTDDAGRAVPSGAYFCRLVQAGHVVYPALKLNVVR